MPDEPRPAATDSDTEFSLSIEEVAKRYAGAGHPRTLRTLQRYCASGHLDARKVATALGDKYLVTSQSVARHIGQIAELAALQLATTSRAEPRPDALRSPHEQPHDSGRQDATGRVAPHGLNAGDPAVDVGDTRRHVPISHSDLSRPVAIGEGQFSPFGAHREAEVDRLHDDIVFLRTQIATKDEQIAALLERDKETNFLVRGLQQMLTPLLGSSLPNRADDGRTPG